MVEALQRWVLDTCGSRHKQCCIAAFSEQELLDQALKKPFLTSLVFPAALAVMDEQPLYVSFEYGRYQSHQGC